QEVRMLVISTGTAQMLVMVKRWASWAPLGTLPKSWEVTPPNILSAQAVPCCARAGSAPTATTSIAHPIVRMAYSPRRASVGSLRNVRGPDSSVPGGSGEGGIPLAPAAALPPNTGGIACTTWGKCHDRGHDRTGAGGAGSGTGGAAGRRAPAGGTP